MLERIKNSGVCNPRNHILDNEASKESKKVIKKQSKIKVVPPDTHRQNIAERTIQIFKNDLEAILSGLDTTFQCIYGVDCCHKLYLR